MLPSARTHWHASPWEAVYEPQPMSDVDTCIKLLVPSQFWRSSSVFWASHSCAIHTTRYTSQARRR